MNLQRLLFGVMYRIGFTPWDGHPLPTRLRQLVEGPPALPRGRAVDLGCGTGDTSIYLAKHGWDVIALDFVEAPLRKARRKAAAAGVQVRWVRDDVTRLGTSVAPGVQLLADNGCLHGLSNEARDAYVDAVTAAAAPEAWLVIAAFTNDPRRRGPRGIDASEIARRFADGWELVGSEVQPEMSSRSGDPIHVHALRRRA